MADHLSHLKNAESRVAFVFNHAFFLGGGEVSLFELIRATDAAVVEPLVIVPEKGTIERQCRDANMRVHVNPLPPLRDIPFGGPVRALLKLTRQLRKSGVDLIHANGSRACFYAGIAGRFLGISVVWHVRETLQDIFFYDALLAGLSRTIVCVSKSVRQKRFARFGPMALKKTRVIYNGVDTGKFLPDRNAGQGLRRRSGIEKDEVLLGIVGNIIPRKGHDFFLKGLASAIKQKPRLRIRILFVGRDLDLPFRDALRQFVLEKGLDSRVIFRDYCEDIQEVYSALDVFVLPSRSEGFSRSLLEAMSSGLPVLATRIGEIQEAVREPQNALLVNFGDIEGMAEAIVKLAEDEALRLTMGQDNRRRAMEKFELNTHARAVEAIYREMSSRNS